MSNYVLVWDLETVPDLPCVARVNGLAESDDDGARAALGPWSNPASAPLRRRAINPLCSMGTTHLPVLAIVDPVGGVESLMASCEDVSQGPLRVDLICRRVAYDPRV